MDIQDYHDFHLRLAAETDPDAMEAEYGMDDNVSLLLDAQDPQLLAVEEMLERQYSRYRDDHDFFMNLAMSQTRYYLHGAFGIFGFTTGHGGMLASEFSEACGEKFPTKAILHFHGDSPDSSRVGQIIVIRDSVVELAKQLMDMNVRFALNRPPAVFEPDQKNL